MEIAFNDYTQANDGLQPRAGKNLAQDGCSLANGQLQRPDNIWTHTYTSELSEPPPSPGRTVNSPLGAGIPDEIFSGATYPFQMFHAHLLSGLLSALPLLAVQAYQRCTHTLKTCSYTLTKCRFTLRSVAGIILESYSITFVRQLLLPFLHMA